MPGVELTAQEFRELFETVSNWGRWGDEESERLGARAAGMT
jgi:hypothetical protein